MDAADWVSAGALLAGIPVGWFCVRLGSPTPRMSRRERRERVQQFWAVQERKSRRRRRNMARYEIDCAVHFGYADKPEFVDRLVTEYPELYEHVLSSTAQQVALSTEGARK